MNAPAKRRPKRIVEVESYLRSLADLMCLKDWTITVNPTPLADTEDELLWADCSCNDGHHATFRFHPRFWDDPADKQRETCAHELGHVPLHRFDGVSNQIRAGCDVVLSSVLLEGMRDSEEHAAEWIARVLAPTLPLPPTFTKPRRRGAR